MWRSSRSWRPAVRPAPPARGRSNRGGTRCVRDEALRGGQLAPSGSGRRGTRPARPRSVLARPHPDAQGSLAMRLIAHEARAARHLLDGQIVETRRAIRNGRLLLWRHRLLFGSTELRAHASSWGAGLADLDLRLSWDRSPRALFEAADRWRAGSIESRQESRTADPETDELLSQYRALHSSFERAQLDGPPPADLVAELRRAERAVTSAFAHAQWSLASRRTGSPMSRGPGRVGRPRSHRARSARREP